MYTLYIGEREGGMKIHIHVQDVHTCTCMHVCNYTRREGGREGLGCLDGAFFLR